LRGAVKEGLRLVVPFPSCEGVDMTMDCSEWVTEWLRADSEYYSDRGGVIVSHVPIHATAYTSSPLEAVAVVLLEERQCRKRKLS
jgi:hypothetical protein